MTAAYDAHFFESIREGCQSSAAALVPKLYDALFDRPGARLLSSLPRSPSVVDVGCGEGHWGAAFRDLYGCEVLGVDGDYADPEISWVHGDLEAGLPNVGEFNLALCLEVAEHLPADCAEGFVGQLCQLAPIVVFSAAVPGQGGVDHRNEQWPAYWRDKFAVHGYEGSGALRWEVWEDARIEWWYRQNLLVFWRDAALGLVEPHWHDGCPGVIHPAAWRHHGRQPVIGKANFG